MASDALLFNFHDALVYEGDARLFKAPGWLNDRCLHFFFRLLEHEEFPDRPDLLFMDPAVVSCMLIQCTDAEELAELGQGLALEQRSLVFLPVNDAEEFFRGGTHWSLLVYVPASRSFYHFDSSQGRNEPAAALTAAKFWQMLGHTGTPVVDVYVACPQQENGYDCGMFAAAIAKHLAHTHVTAPSSSSTGTAVTTASPTRRRRLDTSGLRARVTQDYIDELRRRLGKRVRELAEQLGGGDGGPPT